MYLTIKPCTQRTCTHTHTKVSSVFMLPAKPCLSLSWLLAKVSKNPLRLLEKLFLFLCELGEFHSYHCRRKWIGNISVWGWLALQWELSQLSVKQQLCQRTYLQERVSGWHCNITIVPKNILENCKCCLIFVSKFISSCNYRLYWKSAFALKLYVNQYFPCGVLSRFRRTKQSIPKMVQPHHLWHCMVTLSDHNNNMKTYSTNSGDLQRWLDLACVLSYASQFCIWNYQFWGSSWSVRKSEAAEFPFDLWALVSTAYAVCHVKVHKRRELLFLFLKSHFSNTVSWNFEFLEPTCQIYARTSTVTQDKPLALYLVTQKVFIYQVKQARHVYMFPNFLPVLVLVIWERKHVSFPTSHMFSERVCLFIFIFSSFKFWPIFFICLSPQLLAASNGLCRTFLLVCF